MIFEKIFYFAFILMLLIYFIKRYIKLANKTILINIALQVISLTLLSLTYFNAKELKFYSQCIIFAGGILIPMSTYFIIKYEINLIDCFKLFIGDICCLFKKYNEAVKHYQSVAIKNKSYIAYKKIGNTYMKQNDLRNAFDNYAKAVEIKKDEYKVYYKLAFIYYKLKKTDEAITVLHNTLRIKPEYLPVSNLLAYILCEKENYEDALTVYMDALKYNNDNAEINYNIAVIYTNKSQFEKAKEYYIKAIKNDKYLYEAYYGLGQIYLKDKKYADAEKSLLTAKSKDELYAKAYYALAKVYAQNKEEGKVATALKLAVDKDQSLVDKALSDPDFFNIKDFINGINIINNLDDSETERNSNITIKGFEDAKPIDELNTKVFNRIDLNNMVFENQITFDEVLATKNENKDKKKNKSKSKKKK